MDEYRVKISVRNNLLLSAIEAAGYRGHGSITRFCAESGVCQSQLSSLLSMRAAPITQDGEFSTGAKQIMEALGAAPSDLWTDAQLTMRLGRNTAETTMGQDALQYLLESHVDAMTLPNPEDAADASMMSRLVAKVLGTLTPREEKVLRMRNGIGCQDMTLEECGETLGVTPERVRQIECRAIRKLRNPDRAAELASGAGLVQR